MDLFDPVSVDWDGHLVLIHGTEQHRRRGLAAWARRGFEVGAKVLYNEAPDESPDRSVIRVLEDSDIDVDRAVTRGQFEVFHANQEAYCPEWRENVVDQALAAGYPSVRWGGEASTAWEVMSPALHAEVEWATNDLCTARPLSILCQYPAHLPQAMLQTIIAMHRAGVVESQLRTSPVSSGVRLAGSVDASNERILRSVLVAATATNAAEGGTFSIDLCGLEFLDVSGARALLTGTTAYRIAGGTILLSNAQPAVGAVLRLLGVEATDRFEVEALS